MVDDPFGAEGHEYCNDLTYEEDQDDLHEPPTEEISGEHVAAFEFDGTSESVHAYNSFSHFYHAYRNLNIEVLSAVNPCLTSIANAYLQ